MIAKTDTFYEQLDRLYREVTRFYNELNKHQSRYDKELSALYHELEKAELTPTSGYEFALKLQDVLRKRRVVKDEMARLQPIYNYVAQTFYTLQKQIERAISQSKRVRKSLNVTLSINEVLEGSEWTS
jgi:hypothetical protein